MAVPFSENGGFAATMFYLFVPAISSTGAPYIAVWDTTSFNDSDDPSTYSYRSEDIIVGRVPTVRRIILVVTDLGPATLTITVSGTNDKGNAISSSAVQKIGTTGATNAQLTYFIDLVFTGFRPQLSYSRAANAGPVSIVSATMIGEVEEVTL